MGRFRTDMLCIYLTQSRHGVGPWIFHLRMSCCGTGGFTNVLGINITWKNTEATTNCMCPPAGNGLVELDHTCYCPGASVKNYALLVIQNIVMRYFDIL
jgi:hypothetical protein